MESRIVLVTGGSSGIGEATALLFAEKGYKVAVHGSNQQKVDKVVAECDKLSPNNSKAFGVVANFEDPKDADIVVKKTVEHFGGLDVLVNNAGRYFKPSSQDLNDVYESYRKTQAVNIDSTFRVTYAAIEHLKKSDNDPNIVFVSSVGAKKPSSDAYSMSKAAMSMFAQCLALELAPKIRSNIVSPGPIFTPIFEFVGMYSDAGRSLLNKATPLQRIGEPREVADAIEYLASKKASFMTGSDILIDGGYKHGGVNLAAMARKAAAAAAE